MTRRTLEEIEELAAEATPKPWVLNECSGGAEMMLLGGPSRKYVASIRIHQVPRHMGEWEEKKRAKTAELLEALPDLLAIAQGQREEITRLKRLVKMALLEGVAIGTHREDLTEPWENGERAWNGSKASEEVNMAIGTKK